MPNGKKHSPHPVDLHVGERLRQLRVLNGMSQSALGDILGVTFQQIQKYEVGSNRLSASRLYDISEALRVSPLFFFEGLGADKREHTWPPLTREALTLIQHYSAIEHKPFQAAFLELLKTAKQKAQP